MEGTKVLKRLLNRMAKARRRPLLQERVRFVPRQEEGSKRVERAIAMFSKQEAQSSHQVSGAHKGDTFRPAIRSRLVFWQMDPHSVTKTHGPPRNSVSLMRRECRTEADRTNTAKLF